jgi:hypothetical protein
VIEQKKKELKKLKNKLQRAIDRKVKTKEKDTLTKEYALRFNRIKRIEEKKIRKQIETIQKEVETNNPDKKPTEPQTKHLDEAKLNLLYVLVRK